MKIFKAPQDRNFFANSRTSMIKRILLIPLCFMLLLIPCQPIFTFGISSLAVSGSAEDVCEINGVGFQTLGQALNAVSSGQTIKLLKNIEHNSGIEIIDKRITFDLNGFTLNVVNPVEEGETREISALYVVGDAGVELENEGEFNVTGKYGVFAAGIERPHGFGNLSRYFGYRNRRNRYR